MSQPFTIASNHGAIGGGEVMLLAIAEAARELGRDVTVVAPSAPGQVASQARLRGFRTVEIQAGSSLAYLRNLRRWDAQHRTGLLWCNGLRPALATTGHPNRIVELHQLPRRGQSLLTQVATLGAHRVVVPSHFMAETIPGATILPNWTQDLPLPTRAAPSEPLVVGLMGRLGVEKGVLVACEAIRILERRSPGRFRLLLAGESHFVNPTEARAVDAAVAGLGGLVERWGWANRKQFFAAIDVAIFPSLVSESFGLVVAEAMAARVPFIVSDAGALPEVAGAGHPWPVPAGDAHALADAIESAATDPDRYIAPARRRWEQEYSPAAGRERLNLLLSEVDPPRNGTPRVALAHDYLTQRGGAERVALTLAQHYPGAELTTSIHTPHATYPEFQDVQVKTSLLNRSWLLHRNFRLGLASYGLAFYITEGGKNADVIVVSTTGFAHGIKTRAKKIVYCHSPARFLYLVDDYLGKPWWKSPEGWALMALRPALIYRDKAAARSADVYLANSTVVQQRIKDVYGIDAKVVHPPFAIDPAGEQEPIQLRTPVADGRQFYVLISRLMPYKNVDVAIEAFRAMPERHLLVIGRGPLRNQLRASAPVNVTMAEGVSDAQIRWAYANARAVIAPSKEDFGLTPVEGFAFGTPTVALRSGGYLDTVIEGLSGWFFDEATPAAIQAALAHLDDHPLTESAIREHAQQFSPQAFAAAIDAEIHQVMVDG